MARKPSTTIAKAFPDLAKELVHPEDAELGPGTGKKLEWKCPKGHTYFATGYNRTNPKHPTRCPICNGKQILVGYNDLATTDPDIADLLIDKSLATKYLRNSNTKLKFQCKHGHRWTAPLSRLTTQGSRCPYCSGRLAIQGENDLATTHPNIAAELENPKDAINLKAGSTRKVKWKCPNGHIYIDSPYCRITEHTDCPFCPNHKVIAGYNDLATTDPEQAKHLRYPELATQITRSTDKRVEWVCDKNPKHIWKTAPYNYRKGGCPYCANKKILIGENDLAHTHPDIAAQLVDQSLATKLVAGSGKKVEWRCKYGHTWFATPYRRTGKNPCGCPICAHSQSQPEIELADIVKNLLPDIEVQTNVRTILSDPHQELDIVIPAKSIAVEFNGCVWHSEKFKTSNTYHRDKMLDCRNHGYRLIQIWEDDWRDNKTHVIRALAAKLGVTHNLKLAIPDCPGKWTERLYARKLTFVHLDSKVARTFLNENHIQGYVTASHHFGLLDSNDNVRAILSVRSPRNNARMKRKDGEWEIQRYATCGTVIGGFTKLMSHAEKWLKENNEMLTRWISFSDNCISDGHMYETCGFTKDKEQAPDYRYVGNSNNWTREPKEKYQRKRFRDDPNLIWDESWTEHIGALNNKLYRIYDAGKTRWIKDVD